MQFFKRLWKAVLILLIVLVVVHIGLYVFVNIKGNDIVATAIEKEFGAKATIGGLSLKFPFTVEITDFSCGDVSFKKARARLSFVTMPFHFRVTFRNVSLDELHLTVVKNNEGIIIQPFLKPEPQQISSAKPQVQAPPDAKKRSSTVVPFYIRSIHVSKSVIEFIDETKNPSVRTAAEDIDMRVKNILFPELPKAALEVVSSLRSDTGSAKDSLLIKGWIDYRRKSMDMSVRLTFVNYALFSPYYPHSWKPDVMRIKEAFLTLESTIASESNDVTIDTTLTVDKVEFIEDGEESARRDMARTVIALLKGEKDKAALQFIIKTKMDNPILDFASLKESFKSSVSFGPMIITGFMGKTKETVSGGVDGVTDVTTAPLDITVDTIKNIVDGMKEVFKPEKKKNTAGDGTSDPQP